MAESFETLRDKIVDKLETLSEIQEVYTDPTLNFSGYPAAVVFPVTSDSDYETTNQNERIYSFMVALFYETETTGVGNALLSLYELTDKILDLFDQDFTLSGISMPTGKVVVDIVPVVSNWAIVEDEGVLEIDVQLNIRVSVDLS